MSLGVLLFLFVLFTVVFAYKKYTRTQQTEEGDDSVLDDGI